MINIKNKRLNIFVDESGDFGFKEGSAQLYCVSFVIHESNDSIKNELRYLNNRLKKVNYEGMVHAANLIAKRKEYEKFTLEERKEIFWAMLIFIRKIKVKLNTIIIDKRFKNTKTQLARCLKNEIQVFFDKIEEYISKFDEVVIYYDNGQKTLGKLIDQIIANKNNVEHRVEFNHEEKRLFQVADMMTCLDKIIYEFNNRNILNFAEKYFFTIRDIIRIEKELFGKRL